MKKKKPLDGLGKKQKDSERSQSKNEHAEGGALGAPNLRAKLKTGGGNVDCGTKV